MEASMNLPRGIRTLVEYYFQNFYRTDIRDIQKIYHLKY